MIKRGVTASRTGDDLPVDGMASIDPDLADIQKWLKGATGPELTERGSSRSTRR